MLYDNNFKQYGIQAMKKALLAIGAPLLLVACTTIPVKTLYKLSTTDMLTVDPRILRIGVRMPEWIAPRTNGVRMELGMIQDGKAPVIERFTLIPIPLELESKSLASEGRPGFRLYAYRIAPEDIPRLEAFRQTLKVRKEQSGNKTQGSLAVGVEACRKTKLPEGKAPVTTYLKLDTDAGYLPLVVDYDLKKPVKGKNLAELIPPC